MKILVSSPTFAPSVGGTETVAAILAREFCEAGHTIKLVTQTPDASSDDYPFEVVRRPSAADLFRLVQWCDVYLQNHISLYLAWPLLFVRRPWVVVHHIWLSADWKGRVKRHLTRRATNIAVSNAIAAALPSAITIPNPYDSDVFYERPMVQRRLDVAFVGRLISAKGAHVALDALAALRSEGVRLTLTIIGAGQEEDRLRRQAIDRGIDGDVVFAGLKMGDQLAELLNAHRVLVVPSIWPEPFGIVALEGTACGCVVLAFDVGGLPEAVGDCGETVREGHLQEFTERLAALCTDQGRRLEHRAAAAAHLARHQPTAIAAAYLRVLEAACQ